MLTVLSMFDYSGVWAGAFEAFGCTVVQVDLKHGEDIGRWSARSLLAELLQVFPSIDGVIAAPPCTAFARSGAHAWPAKDADGRTAAAVHLVRQTLRTIDFLQPRFHAIENPPGRLQRLVPEVGPLAFTFNPCDFAGWTTDESDAQALEVLRARGGADTLDDVELVRRTGAYTKHTALWGRFETPRPAELPPVKCSAQEVMRGRARVGGDPDADGHLEPDGTIRSTWDRTSYRYLGPAFGPPQQPAILVLAGAKYIDGWAARARALGVHVDDPLRGYTLGERRAFVKHFTTFWSAWRPEDVVVDEMSRREQLLDSVGYFDDGRAEDAPSLPVVVSTEQFALTPSLPAQPAQRPPRARPTRAQTSAQGLLLGGLA